MTRVTRKRMRVSSVINEAARDLVTGTTPALLLTGVFAAIIVASVALVLTDPLRGLQAARDYRASGASISLIRAEGRVDGSACDALSEIPDIRAAGALRKATVDIVPASLPRAPIPTKDVSQGFPNVVEAPERAARPGPFGAIERSGSSDASGPFGILLNRSVLDTLGSPDATTVELTTGSVRVKGVFDYPEDGRQGDLGYAALVPQPRGDPTPYDECWIDVWPQSRPAVTLLQTVLLPGADDGDERPTTLQLNGKYGATFEFSAARFTESARITSAGTLLGGLGLGWTTTRLRRLELSSARHAGVSRGAQVAGQLLQAVVWLLAGTTVALPFVLSIVSDPDPEVRLALGSTAARTVIVAILAALAGITTGVLTTRETHLFRYFKGR